MNNTRASFAAALLAGLLPVAAYVKERDHPLTSVSRSRLFGHLMFQLCKVLFVA